MGINYYGKCTGVSGGKYDLWLNVSQNSQNVSSNTSNVTVKLLLKRNDGYSASAYNLTESANSVKLTVGGSVKVSKNISIDTRNNVTVTLAQWTGNVSHNADGSLNLDMVGEFSMSSTNLTGGEVTCSFKCTTIPRASSFSLSSVSVNPDSSVKATITYASGSFTHRLIWSVGNESASADIGAGVKEYTMSIPLDWASQVATASKGTLKITLKTYSKGVLIGSVNKNIPFVIPATAVYKPDFNISLQRINNSIPEDFDEYVKGISQLKVDLTDVTYKYGATLQSLTLTVGDVSKRNAPAVFDLTKSGTVKITVSLRDSRGFITQKTQNITVCDYKSPYVTIRSIERCDEDGTLNSQGKYLFIDYALSYSQVNNKNTCEAVLKFKNAKSSAYGDELSLTNSPFIFGDGNIEEGSSYMVSVGVKDRVCQKYIEFLRSVSVAAIPFNIRRGGKGAAFGKFSEKENELEVAWDLKVDGNLSVSGELNYENISYISHENAQNLTCNIRYYPALRMVSVAIRTEVSKDLGANTTHTLATVSTPKPLFFTPLGCVVHFSSGVQSLGGIQGTGEIIIRPSEAISKGTQIFISGNYII